MMFQQDYSITKLISDITTFQLVECEWCVKIFLLNLRPDKLSDKINQMKVIERPKDIIRTY